jgi:hypothetical protein
MAAHSDENQTTLLYHHQVDAHNLQAVKKLIDLAGRKKNCKKTTVYCFKQSI